MPPDFSTAIPGTDTLRAWAEAAGLMVTPRPDPSWFEAWEPFDSMIAPQAYLTACATAVGEGQVILVEPWYALADIEPLDRTLLAFLVDSRLCGPASFQSGEHFNSRALALEGEKLAEMPLPLGDWSSDTHFHARDATVAEAALPPPLLDLLRRWGFQGHLELRPGGLVVHFAGTQPVPEHAQRLLGATRTLHQAALQR